MLICTQELIHRGTPLLDVLRLMVLGNETGHGLPKRALDLLRQEVRWLSALTRTQACLPVFVIHHVQYQVCLLLAHTRRVGVSQRPCV